jgi:hypothetical protein
MFHLLPTIKNQEEAAQEQVEPEAPAKELPKTRVIKKNYQKRKMKR